MYRVAHTRQFTKIVEMVTTHTQRVQTIYEHYKRKVVELLEFFEDDRIDCTIFV